MIIIKEIIDKNYDCINSGFKLLALKSIESIEIVAKITA